MAPSISGDWPQTIPSSHSPHSRLRRIESVEEALEALIADTKERGTCSMQELKDKVAVFMGLGADATALLKKEVGNLKNTLASVCLRYGEKGSTGTHVLEVPDTNHGKREIEVQPGPKSGTTVITVRPICGVD